MRSGTSSFLCKHAARATLVSSSSRCLAQLLKSRPLMAGSMVRIAALGDLHCTKTSQGTFQPLFSKIADAAELLLIAGDLTDYGLPDEARVLARELASIRIPIV